MESRRSRDVREFMAGPPFGVRKLGADELSLIDEALTHDSYSEENPGSESNGRLEFLGDAVLELVVCDALYKGIDGAEGRMTDAKQNIVSNHSISRMVLRNLPSLDGVLRIGNGHKGPDGNVISENMRADAFEALLGALYVLYGMEAAGRVVAEVLLRN